MSKKKIFPSKARLSPGLLAIGSVMVLGLGVCFAGGPAQAQSTRDVMNRLDRLENEISTMSRALYKGEAPPPGTIAGDADARGYADLQIRLQGLEDQIRQLTGRLEEQDHAIAQMGARLDRALSDMDVRLQQGGNAGGGFTQGGSNGGVIGAAPSPSSVPAAAPSFPAQPQADNAGAAYQWSTNNTAAPPVAGGQLGTITAAPPQGAAALYETAFAYLKNGDNARAEQEFTSFLKQYPGDALAGNAKYWLGETYYVRGEYEKAARVFAEAYQEYPKNTKAADNLLKLGMSLASLNKKSDACIAFAQIEKDYAATAGPVIRRAQQEMTRLGC